MSLEIIELAHAGPEDDVVVVVLPSHHDVVRTHPVGNVIPAERGGVRQAWRGGVALGRPGASFSRRRPPAQGRAGRFPSRDGGFGRDVRSAIFAKVETFSQVEVNNFGPASLITRNTNDVQQVQLVVFIARTVINRLLGDGTGRFNLVSSQDIDAEIAAYRREQRRKKLKRPA